MMEFSEIIKDYWPLIAFGVILLAIILFDKNKKRKQRIRQEKFKKEQAASASSMAGARAPPKQPDPEPVVQKPIPPMPVPSNFSQVFSQPEAPMTPKVDLYASVEKINELIKREDAAAHERINKDISNLVKEFRELEAHKTRLEKYGQDLVKVYNRTEEKLNQVGATLYSLQKLDRNLEPTENKDPAPVLAPQESEYYDRSEVVPHTSSDEQEPLPSPHSPPAQSP